MALVKINVRNKIASTEGGRVELVADNDSYIARFQFDSEWDAYPAKTLKIVFGCRKEEQTFIGDTCPIPAIHGYYGPAVIGVYSGDKSTTTPAPIIIKKSINSEFAEHVEPSPDVYEQLIELFNEMYTAHVGQYIEKSRVKKYLYDIYYEALNYDKALEYFHKMDDPPFIGGCSAIKKDTLYARHLDWLYTEQAEFIVKTARFAGRYATVGIAGGLAELTEDFVKENKKSDAYALLPFKLYDGINEHGVVANMNVVPTDKGENRAEPLIEQKVSIPATMLVRFILDNFQTAQEAVEFIRDYAEVTFQESLHAMNYELHFMVADENETYILEFEENRTVILTGYDWMTNFHLHDVIFNQNGTVYTPATQDADHDAIRTNHITSHGCGLERSNIIAEHYNDISSIGDLRELLDELIYTKAYKLDTIPAWYTEFVGERNLTVTSTPEEYQPVVEAAAELFQHRSRDPESEYYGTWQTTHSVIYDIPARTLYVRVQEEADEYVRTVPLNTDSEAWATGERFGNPVKETDETYQNNSKYYAEEAKEAITKAPYIGDNKHWFVWDALAGEYVDTGVTAVGEKGEQGEKGDTGESGVYIGEEEPEDPEIDVWIDPSADPMVLPLATGSTVGGIKADAATEEMTEPVGIAADGKLYFAPISGSGDKSFIFDQMTASTEWTITHNLGKYPSVTVVDSAGSSVIGEVSYLSADALVIRFSGSFSGKAYLN